MYQEFFHFARKPFQNTADPIFFFPSAMHREALATLIYGIDQRKGLTVLVGPVGSGKTNLMRKLTTDRDTDVLVQLPNPQLPPNDFVDTLCRNFAVAKGASEPFQRLEKRLRAIEAEGKLAVLIIDEAHLISEPTLEILRLLLNFESDLGKLIQIVLSGQEELLTTLENHKARPLRQRVALIENLAAFELDETLSYVQHRLRVAGGDPFMFPRHCIERIYQASEGLPRLINQICDNSLIFAFGRQSHQIELSDVQAALDKLPPMVIKKSAANPAPKPAEPAPRRVQSGAPAATPADHSAVRVGEASTQAAKNVASAQPSSPPPMPFHLPVGAMAAHSKVNHAKFLPLYTALIAAAAAALSVWWVLNPKWPSMSSAPDEAVAQISRPKAVQPMALQFDNVASQAALPKPAIATRTEAPASAPVADQTDTLPLPAPTAVHSYTVSRHKPYADEMTKTYGSMNLTVREIVGSFNPDIDLRNPPLKTVLQMPELTRQDMVISDSKGRYLVYFGSYPEQDIAQAAKQELALSQQPVLVLKANLAAPSRTVWRLYVGPYASKSEADSITNLLRFKNIPSLE